MHAKRNLPVNFRSAQANSCQDFEAIDCGVICSLSGKGNVGVCRLADWIAPFIHVCIYYYIQGADCIYPFCLHRRVFPPQSMVVVLSGVIVSSLTSPTPKQTTRYGVLWLGPHTHPTLLSLFFSDSYTTSIVLSCRPCLGRMITQGNVVWIYTTQAVQLYASCVQISQHTLGCLLRSSWYTQCFRWRN